MLKASFNIKLRYFDLKAELKVDKEILVLVGPSGSGKTTILKCLAGLKTPTAGNIQINGRTVYCSEKKIFVPCRERRVGYVFQEYALFPHMTVLKNTMYGIPSAKRKAKLKTAEEILAVLKIAHLKDRYPSQISGGEKQRAALARALMTEPEIMLLDEPLSALDQETRAELQQELIKIHRNWHIPFVLVTHDLNEAQILGDQIIRIDRFEQDSFGCIKFDSRLISNF